MRCAPQPVYRHRPDGKPGREISVSFKDAKLYGPAQVSVTDGKTETTELPPEDKAIFPASPRAWCQ